MTATVPVPLVCPACRSTSTMVGVEGNGLCFDCRHTWNPAEVTALPLETVPPAVPVIDEIAAEEVWDEDPVTGDMRQMDPTTLEWLDKQPHDAPDLYAFDPTWEGLEAYRAVGGAIRDETWWEVRMGAPATDVDPVPSMLDGIADTVQVTVMLAELIVKAGISSVTGSGEDVVPGVPPTNYLPDDPTLHHVIEAAAAMAVGMIITTLHLDVDLILAGLGGITYEETEGDQQTEDSNDASSSDTGGPATAGDDVGGGDQ